MVKCTGISLINVVWPFWVWKDTHVPFISSLTWFITFSIKQVLDEDQKVRNEFLWKNILIPDEEVFRVLDQFDLSWRIVNGFPRTLKQVDYLKRKYNNSLLIILNSETSLIRQRLNNRLICCQCWKVYNKELDGVDIWDKCNKWDSCSWLLIQRPEDYLENIKRRLWVYKEIILPAINYSATIFRTVRIDLNNGTILENQKIIRKKLFDENLLI